MKKDTINLIDTVKIFKKNLKAFYIFIFFGITLGSLGAIVNTNYIEAKSDLTLKITIKNPLKNYYVLDLFTLDSIRVDENGISISETSKKIENYYELTNEYFELLIQTIKLDDYNINITENNYNITSLKKDLNYFLKIENIYNSEEIKNNLSNLANDLDPLILPIVIENIKKETRYIEDFLNSMSYNLNTPNLETLVKLRKDTLKRIESMKVEIFDTTISETKRKTSNSQIIIFSILLSISMFLLFIILKR